MEGKGLTWFQVLAESVVLVDSDTFVKASLLHFGPSCYDDLMKTLIRPKQLRSVEEYNTFKNPFNRLF